jgi:multiple sugar transport system substrate-binding protein
MATLLLTRRRLLRQLTLLTGAAALSACAPSAPAQPAAPTAGPTAPPKPTAAPPAGGSPAASPVAGGSPVASPVAGSPVPASPVASPAAAAPPTGPSTAAKPQYKLDLGGYTGPAPTSQPVKLRLMRQVYAPAGDTWWKNLYAKWAEAYPNITVEEETLPYGDLAPKLLTHVASGDPPDIMMGKGDFVLAYVYNAIALNLSDLLSADFIADITPSVKSQLVVDGRLYAWPYESSQIMTYFNKDLWQKAGLQTPPEVSNLSEGWSWDQYEDAWQKLPDAFARDGSAESGVTALASSDYGNGGPGSNYFIEGIFIRSEGDPAAPKESSVYKTFAGVSADGIAASGYVDTPEAVQGMQRYQRLFQRKLSPTTAVPRQFDDGKAATRFGPFGFSVRYKNPESSLKFAWGASPVPRGKIAFNHTSGDSPIIAARTKYPAEAAALMAFAHNDENRVAWHKAWGSMPVRGSLFEKMGYTNQIEKLGAESLRGGYPAPITPGYLEYFGAINTAVKDVALGASPDDRLKKIAKEIDDLLSRYKK